MCTDLETIFSLLISLMSPDDNFTCSIEGGSVTTVDLLAVGNNELQQTPWLGELCVGGVQTGLTHPLLSFLPRLVWRATASLPCRERERGSC